MTDYKSKGFKDAREGKKASLPSDSDWGVADHIVANVVIPVIGTAMSVDAACQEKKEKKENPNRDADYIDGYETGLKANEKESEKGGCFVSTACVHVKGLADDCDELETLRNYRDDYLLTKPYGKKLVEKYYAIAPRIVASIETRSDAEEIYSDLYDKLILPMLSHIRSGQFLEATTFYTRYVTELETRFL